MLEIVALIFPYIFYQHFPCVTCFYPETKYLYSSILISIYCGLCISFLPYIYIFYNFKLNTNVYVISFNYTFVLQMIIIIFPDHCKLSILCYRIKEGLQRKVAPGRKVAAKRNKRLSLLFNLLSYLEKKKEHSCIWFPLISFVDLSFRPYQKRSINSH